MAARQRHANQPVEAGTVAFTPDALTRQEFGRRLHKLLIERRWNQSDLARAADLKRDSISAYINGKRWPTPLSQDRLATALGMTVSELLPNALMHAIDDEVPAFEMKIASGHPGKAWVRLNRFMSMHTATKIAELLNIEDQRTTDQE